ncbi:MAG: hypothetical protein IPL79_06875 [Myxococcales bacterium]|nr:hypothetical protein [Myxococcales bacterium]
MTRIFANPIYAQLSQSLAGAHEYAAMSTLQELAEKRQYDLIIVDTPPSRHAVDFLDAPAKLGEFIDSPAIEWFRKLRPGSGSGFSVLGRSGAFVLSRLARFVGNRFLEDLAVFITEFHDVLGGFREKATSTYALLRRPDVGVIVVSSPEPYALAESRQLAARLVAHQVTIIGMIANRVHQPQALSGAPDAVKAAIHDVAMQAGYSVDAATRATSSLWQAYTNMEALALADQQALAAVERELGVPMRQVPAAARDIHDVAALADVAAQLVAA